MDKVLQTAVKRDDVEAVREQLRSGADVNSRDRYGQTALMLAARDGHQEIVEMLIAHGADLNVTAKYSLSALMLAIINGHTEIARILARAGTDLNIRGSGAPGFFGKSAYDLAVTRQMRELYDELRPK